jgi:isopentenyl diphosphate isomerase/L-lactate dehydrogenase-like FMN-dependent dehydrogenase
MVFVGRATLYGATVGGEAGALHAINLLKSEIDRVMALLGCNTIGELGPQFLHAAVPALKSTAVSQRQQAI